MELTKKLIKRKRRMLAGTSVGKIIAIETIRRTAHHVIKSPIALSLVIKPPTGITFNIMKGHGFHF